VTSNIFGKRPLWFAAIPIVLMGGALITPPGRSLASKWLGSLRLQKVQAVNLDFSPFVDANANPALQQMVSQMISEKVEVSVNEANQPVADWSAASTAAGFPVQLIATRKDPPKLVVSGRHELKMTVDRSRLQEILKAAGHPEILLPESLDGASFSVKIPGRFTPNSDPVLGLSPQTRRLLTRLSRLHLQRVSTRIACGSPKARARW